MQALAHLGRYAKSLFNGMQKLILLRALLPIGKNNGPKRRDSRLTVFHANRVVQDFGKILGGWHFFFQPLTARAHFGRLHGVKPVKFA